MTREEFIKILEGRDYSYKINDEDKLVISSSEVDIGLGYLKTIPPNIVFNNMGTINLNSLTTLPKGIVFKNGKRVSLSNLIELSPDTVFENGWGIDLDSLKTIPPGVVFKNGSPIFKNGSPIFMQSLTTIPKGVVFENTGDIRLDMLIGGWSGEWRGNVQDVNNKRLLNLMISKGIFER